MSGRSRSQGPPRSKPASRPARQRPLSYDQMAADVFGINVDRQVFYAGRGIDHICTLHPEDVRVMRRLKTVPIENTPEELWVAIGESRLRSILYGIAGLWYSNRRVVLSLMQRLHSLNVLLVNPDVQPSAILRVLERLYNPYNPDDKLSMPRKDKASLACALVLLMLGASWRDIKECTITQCYDAFYRDSWTPAEVGSGNAVLPIGAEFDPGQIAPELEPRDLLDEVHWVWQTDRALYSLRDRRNYLLRKESSQKQLEEREGVSPPRHDEDKAARLHREASRQSKAKYALRVHAAMGCPTAPAFPPAPVQPLPPPPPLLLLNRTLPTQQSSFDWYGPADPSPQPVVPMPGSQSSSSRKATADVNKQIPGMSVYEDESLSVVSEDTWGYDSISPEPWDSDIKPEPALSITESYSLAEQRPCTSEQARARDEAMARFLEEEESASNYRRRSPAREEPR